MVVNRHIRGEVRTSNSIVPALHNTLVLLPFASQATNQSKLESVCGNRERVSKVKSDMTCKTTSAEEES